MTQTESVPTEHSTEMPSLAGDFPRISYEEWEVLVAKVLNRGRPEGKQLTPEQAVGRLRVTTVDGVTINPLYVLPDDEDAPPPTGLPGVMPFTRGREAQRASTEWDVRAFHDDPDVAITQDAIAADLERGATSLWLRVGADGIAPGDVTPVLGGVDFASTPVAVDSADDQDAAARSLQAAWEAAGAADDAVRGSLGIDPFARAARRGGDIDTTALVTWARICRDRYPGVVPVSVDVRPYHDAGAGDVEEIAFSMATAVEILRALDEAGIPPAEASGLIEFRVVVSEDQFASIAKLRALRRLWARIGEVLDVPEAARGARTHAVTSERMMTRDDPYVNMLRTTIACFAGAVGNADAITVLPFDNAVGYPNPFSRRIARNTQVILAAESHLGRVADPGGGSFYLEALTGEFASRAWELFGTIEAGGGMRAALESGRIRQITDEVQAERDKRLANRALPVTGVSTFPNLKESQLERPARTPLPPLEGKVARFPARRDSEVYERLRDRASAAGEPPAALLIGLGTRRDYGAREGFAAPLLAAGGVAANLVEVAGPDQIAEVVAANPARVAMICSSPKVNGDMGADAARALKDAGVPYVYLAGNPREIGEGAALLDGSIAMGCDVVRITSAMLDQLGVPPLSTDTTSQQGAGA